MFLKQLQIPSGTSNIKAVQLWEVRWESSSHESYFGRKREVEVFTSSEEADAFAKSLINAAKLLRLRENVNATITKA